MFLRTLTLAATLAQDPTQAPPQETTPQKGSYEELEKRIEALKKQHEEEIAELRDEIDKLQEDAAAARAAAQAPSQQALSVFNPAITVFANFLYRTDDKPVFVDDDPTAARVDESFGNRDCVVIVFFPSSTHIQGPGT